MLSLSEALALLLLITGLLISLSQILRHLLYYTEPSLQLYIVRILWMLPVCKPPPLSPQVFGLSSWLTLRFPHRALLFSSFRDWYPLSP